MDGPQSRTRLMPIISSALGIDPLMTDHIYIFKMNAKPKLLHWFIYKSKASLCWGNLKLSTKPLSSYPAISTVLGIITAAFIRFPTSLTNFCKIKLNFKSLPVTWCTNSLTFNNCMLCFRGLICIYMFCIYLRTKSDLCHLQHKLIGFYNRDEKCLQRGTDWVFK